MTSEAEQVKHTALPWRFVPWHIEEGPPAVRAPEGWVVAHTSSDANAEFIAHAVNSHYDLLAALKNIAEATSAEDDAGENYRWDDREGALDYAYATARAALSRIGAA